MEYKKPECFQDMLILQNVLEKNIRNNRRRTKSDILMSLIAEVVEFNEETLHSHKTWKEKRYSKDKELEELTDIFFFVCQYFNYHNTKGKELENEMKKASDIFDKFIGVPDVPQKNKDLIYFIDCFTTNNLILAMRYLVRIVLAHGYLKSDILNTYWTKWQKNMDRIGKEWR